MEKIKKILAPTDFSEPSCRGVRRALEMARSTGAELIVYHVIEVRDRWISPHENYGPVRDMLAQHKRMLDRFLREKFAGYMNLLEVRQVVELGTAHSNILAKAKQEKVDIIVMSTQGKSALDHLLIGSVTAKVVGRAPCAVLVIPASARQPEEQRAA